MPKWANNIASKAHFKCFRHSARQACLVFCCHATSECFIFGNVSSVVQMQRLVVHVLECLFAHIFIKDGSLRNWGVSHHGGVRSAAGRLCHDLGRYSLWWRISAVWIQQQAESSLKQLTASARSCSGDDTQCGRDSSAVRDQLGNMQQLRN